MDDSVIMCDEVIESQGKNTEAKLYDQIKTVPTNFNEKKQPVKHKISIFAFLLITIALLIAVSIYCYLIKY